MARSSADEDFWHVVDTVDRWRAELRCADSLCQCCHLTAGARDRKTARGGHQTRAGSRALAAGPHVALRDSAACFDRRPVESLPHLSHSDADREPTRPANGASPGPGLARLPVSLRCHDASWDPSGSRARSRITPSPIRNRAEITWSYRRSWKNPVIPLAVELRYHDAHT